MNNKTTVYKPKRGIGGKVRFLAIAAHHDDIEILATDGILRSNKGEGGFVGVVVTDGSGSARDGEYAHYTDEMMKRVRVKEQNRAADIGKYQEIIYLNRTSKDIKNGFNSEVLTDIIEIILKYQPEIVYTHNLCDKHPTHIGVVMHVIESLKSLESRKKPLELYGVEVWKDLDWMVDKNKVVFDVSSAKKMTKKQLLAHRSQVVGGKRYDTATIGRRSANATYYQSHSVDVSDQMIFAMDLLPLIDGSADNIIAYAKKQINDFEQEVISRLSAFK